MSQFSRIGFAHSRVSILQARWARPTASLLALLLVAPIAAHAQAGGTPFDTGFTAIQTLFTGTIAKVASLVAIVIGGYGFAHGEPGAKKALAGVAAGTGIAVLAVNVLTWLWGVQLHTAITENRKSQNPVILGFQGRSQMEARYGEDSEAMLSQPATKIFLRTTEPRAAKWVSEAIGEIEIERLRETHSDGTRAGRNFALDRQTEPLVLPSEISGLDDLRGFLKHGNHVARFSFPFIELEEKNPGFDERKMDDLIVPTTPLPVEPEAVQGNLLFPEHAVQTSGHEME